MKNMFSEDDGAVQTTSEQAIQTAGNGSTQKAGDDSTQTASNDSTQPAGWCSTQIVGRNSIQIAGDRSTQIAWGNYITQMAGINTVQIIHWYNEELVFCVSTRIITEKEANIPYKFYDGDWHLIEIIKKVNNEENTDRFNNIKKLEKELNEALKNIEILKKQITHYIEGPY